MLLPFHDPENEPWHNSFPEQLEKIEAGMDSINADMQIAEKALKGMELCCGIFPKFWKKWDTTLLPKHAWIFSSFLSCLPYFRSNEFKEDDAVWKGGEDGGVGGGGPPPTQMGGMGPQGGYVAK